MPVLALDTSNYTTSVAVFDGCGGIHEGRLLEVRPGELGLRQSDALFQHVKRLPELFTRMQEQGWFRDITAVGASTRPRAIEGSYMPCFLAGASQGQCLAQTLGVPFYAHSHQQGHLAAAAWSAGRLDLLDRPFLAWHLSGGTTELLKVEPDGYTVTAEIIGGTSDISAGQLIDRTAQMLQLSFPGGKHIDALSKEAAMKETFKVKCANMEFSLSGVQNKVQQFHAVHGEPAETAAYALRCVAKAVYLASEQAMKTYPGLQIVFSGGVASNSMLREVVKPLNPIFSQPEFSTDNAMGVAVLAHRAAEA